MSEIIAKTTFTFIVLHRADEPFTNGISEAIERANDGHAIGLETAEVTEGVPNDQVATEEIALGCDGTFFQEDINDED